VLVKTRDLKSALGPLVQLTKGQKTPTESAVMLSFDGSTLTLRAHVRSVELRYVLSGEDEHPAASICVNAKNLLKQIRACKASVVNLEIADGLQLKSGVLNCTLAPQCPASIMPSPICHSGDDTVIIDSTRATDMAWVVRAMGCDETRKHINALYLDASMGMMVATDGHRLHAAPCGTTRSALIPALAASLFPKLCEHGAAMQIGPDSVQVTTTDGTLRCRNLTGSGTEFPPWTTLLSPLDTMTVRIVLNRNASKEWMTALKPLANEGATFRVNGTVQVRCASDASDTILELPTTDKVWRDYGECATRDVTIGFNPRYIADAVLDACSVHLPSDPLAPCRVISGERQALVMPTRL